MVKKRVYLNFATHWLWNSFKTCIAKFIEMQLSKFSLCYNADSATNPVNRDEDWETITKFCEQVNKELEGPQIAIRLLAHKIQSPQEREALYALAVSFNFFHVLQTLYYMWYLLFSVNSKQPLFIYTAKQRLLFFSSSNFSRYMLTFKEFIVSVRMT